MVPTVNPNILQFAMVELTLGGLSCDEEITGDVLTAIETAVAEAVETEYIVVGGSGVNVTSYTTSDCPAGSVGDYVFDIAILYADPADLPMMSRRLQLQGSEVVSLLNMNSVGITASLSGSGLPIFGGEFSVAAFNAVTDAPSSIPTGSPTAQPSLSPTDSPTVIPSAAPTASPTAAPTASPTAAPTASPTAAPTPVPAASPTATPVASPVAPPVDSAGAMSSVKYALIFALTYFVGAVLEM